MPRLGELLVAAGQLTADQLEQGLRAQVMWGARLGTNLVELGFLDLDALSNALGRQHNLPAALARHFEQVDRELQNLMNSELARKLMCLPLVRVGPKRDVVIAAIGPLTPRALAMVADELCVEVPQLIPSVAAELRIRYQLENVYQIRRTARFMRSPGLSSQPFPQVDEFALETDPNIPLDQTPAYERALTLPYRITEPEDVEELEELEAELELVPEESEAATTIEVPVVATGEIPIDIATGPEPVSDAAEPAAAEPLAAEPLATSETDAPTTVATSLDDLPRSEPGDELAVPTEIDEEAQRLRRKYVRTIADGPEPPPITRATPKALGRISIRRVALDTSGMPAPGNTLGEATRAIRRAPERDLVAHLVIDALSRFAQGCEAALILVVRGQVATSWKGFNRTGAALSEISVPLDQPGLVPRAVHRSETARATRVELGPIDELLMAALGAEGELAVVPVSIAGQVMCLLSLVTEPESTTAAAESIAAAAGAAFGRLMRDASR